MGDRETYTQRERGGGDRQRTFPTRQADVFIEVLKGHGHKKKNHTFNWKIRVECTNTHDFHNMKFIILSFAAMEQ